MGNKGRGEKTKMNKGRREGQGERANNNKEFSYVFVWCLFRSLIGPKSGQNPKKKKHPNLQPHCLLVVWLFDDERDLGTSKCFEDSCSPFEGEIGE